MEYEDGYDDGYADAKRNLMDKLKVPTIDNLSEVMSIAHDLLAEAYKTSSTQPDLIAITMDNPSGETPLSLGSSRATVYVDEETDLNGLTWTGTTETSSNSSGTRAKAPYGDAIRITPEYGSPYNLYYFGGKWGPEYRPAGGSWETQAIVPAKTSFVYFVAAGGGPVTVSRAS